MFKKESLIQNIRSVNHFKKLSDNDLEEIIGAGIIKKYKMGDTLFFENDSCSGMFVLLSGKIHLRKIGPKGQEVIMAIIDPIIMFNEIATIDGEPNPFSAIAIQNSLIWKISHENFHILLNKFPEIGNSLLNVLAKRNRMLISNYEDISFRSVIARTAKFLLDVSNFGTITIQRKDYSINEIAARIATVPELISRSLHQLSKDGLINYSRTEIQILKPLELADAAQISPSLLIERTKQTQS